MTTPAPAPMTAAPDTRPPVEHELKTWASYFHALVAGTKTFELRRDDRGFRVGDTLRLRETNYGDGAYTGRELTRRITHVLRHESDLGLMDGFCILSLEAELAAARKVEDGEVADVVGWLRDTAAGLFSPDAHYGAQLTKAADLLTRLSAALKEAERREPEAKTLQHQLASDLTVAIARTQAAEAKLETATSALETCAAKAGSHTIDGSKPVDYDDPGFLGIWGVATAALSTIRALQTKDTTP